MTFLVSLLRARCRTGLSVGETGLKWLVNQLRNEVFSLPYYCAAYVSSCLTTFRDRLLVPSTRGPCLTVEDGTDKLFRNVSEQLPKQLCNNQTKGRASFSKRRKPEFSAHWQMTFLVLLLGARCGAGLSVGETGLKWLVNQLGNEVFSLPYWCAAYVGSCLRLLTTKRRLLFIKDPVRTAL